MCHVHNQGAETIGIFHINAKTLQDVHHGCHLMVILDIIDQIRHILLMRFQSGSRCGIRGSRVACTLPNMPISLTDRPLSTHCGFNDVSDHRVILTMIFLHVLLGSVNLFVEVMSVINDINILFINSRYVNLNTRFLTQISRRIFHIGIGWQTISRFLGLSSRSLRDLGLTGTKSRVFLFKLVST